MVLFNLDHVVPVYQEAIDTLINELGKPIRLYFPPQITGDTDKVSGGSKLPSFKTGQSGPTEVSHPTKEILGLIKYNPKDFHRFNINIDQNHMVLRIKTFIDYLSDLQKCDFIIPVVSGVIQVRYKLIRTPQPVGLKFDRYCKTYWISQ